MIEELKAKAANHWRTWLPKKWAALVAEDRVDEELTRAAIEAEKAIRQWMDGGARQDEAEEIVLPEFILLKPEPNGKTPEEKRLEREYQEIYGTPPATSRKQTSR